MLSATNKEGLTERIIPLKGDRFQGHSEVERGLFAPLTTLAGSAMWGELTKLTEQRCRDLEDGLGLLVQVLSLDVAIDQDYGNLDSSSQNWAKIAQAVSNGWVAAAVLATLSVRQGIINLQKQKDVIGHGRCARRNGLGESPGSSPKRCGSFFCEAHSLFRRYGL